MGRFDDRHRQCTLSLNIFDHSEPEQSGVLLSVLDDGVSRSGRYLLHNHTVAHSRVPTAVGELFTLDYIWKNIDMFCCQVVNLSACSSGMVDWSERSDEFYGMANGFLYAGALKVLAALWPVHDLVSEVFNLLFYEELLTNRRPVITAFKTTLERLKEFETEGIRPFAHPFFWAGYRVIGFS
jgi:CHAT domain-containing protein